MELANDAQTAFFAEYNLADGDEWLNKRQTVLRKGERVYKLAKDEKEYLETYTFYKQHQTARIVPPLVLADQAALVVVTQYMPEYVTLHRMVTDNPQMIDKNALQLALIRGLAKFKDASFGKDLQANLRNIGFISAGNEESHVIFFEDNGERFSYRYKSEMIFQFLYMLKGARSGQYLLEKILPMQEIETIVQQEERVFSDNETISDE